uniref:Uncharacterized protein n=1 Tax=Cacopsylla melanoneura TaxID=428564 RepID=A0A8D8WBG6_9HEMI
MITTGRNSSKARFHVTTIMFYRISTAVFSKLASKSSTAEFSKIASKSSREVFSKFATRGVMHRKSRTRWEFVWFAKGETGVRLDRGGHKALVVGGCRRKPQRRTGELRSTQPGVGRINTLETGWTEVRLFGG